MRRPSINQKNANREQIIAYCKWYCNNPLQHAKSADFDSLKAYDLQATAWVLQGFAIPSMIEYMQYGESFETNMRNSPDINYDQLELDFPSYKGSALETISLDNDRVDNKFGFYKDAKLPIHDLIYSRVPSKYLIINPKRKRAQKRFAKKQAAEWNAKANAKQA